MPTFIVDYNRIGRAKTGERPSGPSIAGWFTPE